MEFPMRINKYLSQTGKATRKEADALTEAGKVFVNGKKAVLGQKVLAQDKVEIRGGTRSYEYYAFYKPRGVITHSPAEGETDIETFMKEKYKIANVFPVGRLDKDSEGLMILTNDGRITERLLNPINVHEREYEITVDKPITSLMKRKMERGVNIEGYVTKPTHVEAKKDLRFSITLVEGKKHQIRRMCAALGYQVKKLTRVRTENILLGSLKSGQYRTIKGAELNAFLTSLGLKA